jgi:hypothetical protein
MIWGESQAISLAFFFAPNHYGVVSEITKKLLNEINTWYRAIRFLYFFY